MAIIGAVVAVVMALILTVTTVVIIAIALNSKHRRDEIKLKQKNR